METISENKSYGGVQGVYTHASATCQCEMTFGLYLPPQAATQKVPVIWYLSGLTCTHENAMVKAGAQAHAAKHGVAVIFPDTSPRNSEGGESIADDESYDLGQGAGFYVDATQAPWAPHFQMWSYITQELPALVFDKFNLDAERQSIMGHSMGGHGALTMAMTYPEIYRSVSAFAPITNPSGSEWGGKQLGAYLGDDKSAWERHDASLLMAAHGFPGPVLIDQGADDEFADLLKPEKLAEAIAIRRQPATYRLQAGYDHSYFFVSTFMGDHIAHHAHALR
ncbi:MAG: S-formylglutathione hydrolase [Alphaproteobacteria bacterium]